MFIFEHDLHIIQLLVPSICSGILLLGLLLFLYIYLQTKKMLHLSMFIMAFCAFLFVSGELLILIFGGWYKISRVGMQFHRIEQLAGAMFLFAVPYFIHNILILNKRWKLIDRYIISACLLFLVVLVLFAFIVPDTFVSQSVHRATYRLNAWDYGRGQEGELYKVRDIMLGVMIIYIISCFSYDLIKNKNFKTAVIPLFGILVAVAGAVDDTIAIHNGDQYIFFSSLFFSRFSLGITVFVITSMIVIIRDYITQGTRLESAFVDLKSAYRSLHNSERRFKQIAENINEVFIIYDYLNNIVIYVSPGFESLSGFTVDHLYEAPDSFFDLLLPDDAEKLREALKPGNLTDTVNINYRVKRSDGNIRWIGSHIYAIHDNQGKVYRLIIILDDITDRKKGEEELLYIAYHDVLTGLPNRRAFFERFYELIMQANREKPKNKKALFYIDLDRLKNINDLMGHDIGDAILELFPIRMKKCLRKSDYFFRIGGDEFTIILNGIVNELDAAHVAEKLIEEVRTPYLINNREIYQNISIGISLYPEDSEQADVLVKNADIALHEAKKNSESYVFYNDDMNKDALERITIENNFMGAIEQGQFELYYQPLIGLQNEIIGMESLLRWNHPELGFVRPDSFISIAEATGFILNLGRWAIELACKQMKEWIDLGYNDIWMSVNLSALQFGDDNLVPMITGFLKKYNLHSSSVKLEITESSIMDKPDIAEKKINQLKEFGIEFCIDDFGTGYSSLSYLNRFNLSHLKIDRSFIDGILNNQNNQEITKAIIAMAHNLNLKVVAEGVESHEQAEFLRSIGCDVLQGYLYSEPVNSDNFLKLLQEGTLEKGKI